MLPLVGSIEYIGGIGVEVWEWGVEYDHKVGC